MKTPRPVQRTIDYLRARGLVATLRRVAAELAAHSGFAPAPGSLVPRAKDRGVIHCHVDASAPDLSTTGAVLEVAGWAFSESGANVRVDLYIDDRFQQGTAADLQRQDVEKAFPAYPRAAASGFAAGVPIPELSRGSHNLILVLRDDQGAKRTISIGFQCVADEVLYERIHAASLLTGREAKQLAARLATNETRPRFKLWVEAGAPAEFERTMHSLAAQSYADWSCTVLCPNDEVDQRRASVERWLSREECGARIRFAPTIGFSPAPDGERRLSAVLTSGETLGPHALLEVAAELAGASEPALVYSDSDRIDAAGRHCRPELKPDWSPEHLLSRNYIGGIFFFDASAPMSEAANQAARSPAPGWRFDLLLRLTETEPRVVHIARALWSEPVREDGLRLDAAAECEAVRRAFERRGDASVVSSERDGIRRVTRPLAKPPRVSIIVPTTGRMDHLRPCVESLVKTTAYPDYELIFIDNGRGEHPEGIEFLHDCGYQVLERHEPFNWAKLNNDGAREATGELLLFLNDDVEITDGAWLTELARLAVLPDIGCVGALLLYGEGLIQHAGVFLVDHGGGARHFLQRLDPAEPIPGDLQHVTREVTANTGACFMLRRSLFDELDGFDEELPLIGNDVDLSLRLRRTGYRNLWTPHCRLTHHESLSRKDAAIGSDERKMWSRWEQAFLDGDPYYNANYDLQRSDCSLARRPRSRQLPEPARDGRPGVNLIGYVSAEMGVGEAVRGIARALDDAGLDFDAFEYTYGNPSRQGDQTWSHRIRREPRFDINILHINADLTPAAVRVLPAELFAGRYTIGYWAWELPEFPDAWVGAFEYVDEVWVPSEFVRESIAKKSPVPVTCIPHILDKGPGPYLGRTHFELPADPLLFLTMFDAHSVTERKNPEGAIEAFKSAFAPDDMSVGLVVKASNSTPNQEKRIRRWVGSHENIHLVTSPMARHEVDSLITACDCFVSLHRAEGFGLPIAEAMALGQPVIATHWSGNADFMRPENAACIHYELRTLERDFGPYERGNVWAEPDVHEAADWMRRIAQDPQLARRLGAAGRSSVREELSPRTIGRLIENRLSQLP